MIILRRTAKERELKLMTAAYLTAAEQVTNIIKLIVENKISDGEIFAYLESNIDDVYKKAGLEEL